MAFTSSQLKKLEWIRSQYEEEFIQGVKITGKVIGLPCSTGDQTGLSLNQVEAILEDKFKYSNCGYKCNWAELGGGVRLPSLWRQLMVIEIRSTADYDDPDQWIEFDRDQVAPVWSGDFTGGIMVTGLVFDSPSKQQWEQNDCQDTARVLVKEVDGDLEYSPQPPYQHLRVEVLS